MFEITCLVEPKKLAQALWVLDGLVLNLGVRPVKEAKQKGGRVVSTARPGSLPVRVAAVLHERKIKNLDLKTLKEIGVEQGGSTNHVKNLSFLMVKDKVLKRLPDGGFTVL